MALPGRRAPKTEVPTAIGIAERVLRERVNAPKDAPINSSNDYGDVGVDIVVAARREEARIPTGPKRIRLLLGREARLAKAHAQENLRALSFLAINSSQITRVTYGQVQLRHGRDVIPLSDFGYMCNEVEVNWSGNRVRVTNGHWPQLDDTSGLEHLPTGVSGEALVRVMNDLLEQDAPRRDASIARSWEGGPA